MQGLATLWLLSTPAVSGQLHRWVLHYPPPDLSAPIDADAIVILGGRTREVAAEYEESAVRAIVLVTSALHMRRAVEEFESQGLRVIAAPVDTPGPHEPEWIDFVVPGIAALRESHNVLYEFLGRLASSLA